jgi:hypothetical protein
MKLRSGLIFPVLLIASAFSCKKPKETASGWKEYQSPVIEKVSLLDSLSSKALQNLNIKEINGVRVIYKSGKSASYFEYEADACALLKVINTLPFKRTNAITDTVCRAMEIPFSLSGKVVLSEEEIAATYFFWEVGPKDFLYYECIKAPQKHTILISKTTDRVFHRIESPS